MLPSTFTISSDVLVVKIEESKGKLEISRRNNDWKREVIEEKIIYFQSELSNVLIEDILIKEKCFLPTYKESIDLHIPFIKCLLTHMNKVTGEKHTVCPIT